MALLSAETKHILQKRARRERQPLEALACALLSTLVFAAVFLCLSFRLRYDDYPLAVIIGPGIFSVLALALLGFAVVRHRRMQPKRLWISLAIAVAAGVIVGCIYGNKNWWDNGVHYYTYQDMASYVNVDPGTDVGQSFMDAGTVYFKESSYVLKQKALAFHNGATYCVAPIVRQPVQMQASQPTSFQLETLTGFAPPRSGTIDFWAVGKDCCGDSGETFTCGESSSMIARSGLRLLDANARAMYLLAVQEWSASAGLPVRHPIFFNWVKDPLTTIDDYSGDAWSSFGITVLIYILIALVSFFLLGMIFQKLHIA